MNENEFECNGKTYIAVDQPPSKTCICEHCAFGVTGCIQLRKDAGIPLCYRDGRKDNRSVIFVEKPQEEKKTLKLFDDRDCVTFYVGSEKFEYRVNGYNGRWILVNQLGLQNNLILQRLGFSTVESQDDFVRCTSGCEIQRGNFPFVVCKNNIGINNVIRAIFEKCDAVALSEQESKQKVNENEFTIDGKTYISKLSPNCLGCIFDDPSGCSKPVDVPSCISQLRNDQNDVIFTKKPKIENVDENEFVHNGKTYVSKPAQQSCKECAFLHPYDDGEDCGKPDDISSCIAEERGDHTDVIFVEKSKIENKKQTNKPLKNNNMQNYIEKIKNLIVPSINNDFVFTMDGKLGLKNNEKIISYDKDTKEFTEYPEDFGIEVPVFEMSTPANQVKEGDIIKHNTSWVIVKSVNNDSISVLSFMGTSKKVQVIKNFLLGQKLVRKVMSFDFQGNNNMNSMMMLALMDGKGNDDTLKTMLMMQMMQGNNQGFNPMMMLMLDKSTNMKNLLIMNMLNGVQLPFFNNQNTTTKK